MTEIKSAIDHYRDVCVQMGQYPESDTYRYAELAIRSLQAWEEVLNQLQEWKDSAEKEHEYKIVYAYFSAIKIINQKLAEIEE